MHAHTEYMHACGYTHTHTHTHMHTHTQYTTVINGGVYKQWTGPLEWWNSGTVDYKVFVHIVIILSYPIVFAPNFLHSYTYTVAVHSYWLIS